MSQFVTTWPSARPTGPHPGWMVPLAVVAGVGLATLAALVAGNGNLIVAVVPVMGAAALWAVLRSPVRNTLFLLFFFGLALDRPGDGNGMWASPLVSVGGLLMHNISNTVPVSALKFSGLLFMLGLLMLVRTHRVLSGRLVDTPGGILPAPPLNWSLAVSFVTVIGLVVWGLANGGNSQMAKVQTQVIIPTLVMAFVLGPSLRGGRDYRTLAKVIVAAACCKALMALWIRHVLPPAVPDQWGIMREVEYATSHGDSLLFACACLILLARLFFEPSRRHVMTTALIAPLLVAGMLANARRLVWVQLAAGVVLMIVANPRNWFTRRLLRTTILCSPLLAVYIGVGWFSSSSVFAPVATMRSLVNPQRSDGSIDRSTLFRDVENYNLIYTFGRNPFMGRGFGHAFDAPVANDDMSGFKEYPYLPHNSILGLMGFAGGFGFIGLLSPLVVALFLASRAERLATTPDEAMAAAVAIGNIAAFLMHLWGDIGFTEHTSIFTVGGALAVAAQVAASTGAWRVARPRSLASPQ